MHCFIVVVQKLDTGRKEFIDINKGVYSIILSWEGLNSLFYTIFLKSMREARKSQSLNCFVSSCNCDFAIERYLRRFERQNRS